VVVFAAFALTSFLVDTLPALGWSTFMHDALVASYADCDPMFMRPPPFLLVAATLEIEEEEDIDLSEELAELKGEEETNGEELFDGEPIGIYTMPSLTDEPEFEMPRFTFGRTRVEPILGGLVAIHSGWKA